jgi:cell division protein FtsW
VASLTQTGTGQAPRESRSPKHPAAKQSAPKDPAAQQSDPERRLPSASRNVTAWLRAVLDRPLTSYHLVLASAGLLLALGMLMVLSASSVNAYVNYGDSYYFIKRQMFFLFVGLVAIVAIVRMPRSTLRVLGWVGLAGASILLILTYTPLGIEFQGNRNWLTLGPSFLRIQPSEFAKLALVVWGADILARKEKLLDQPKHLLIPYLPAAGLIIMLIVFQGDAGTAAVVIGIVGAVLWMVGAPLRVFAGLTAAGIAGIAVLVLTSPTRISRFQAFLNPTASLDGINHQATIGMYAIASGGWWGVGLGASRQKWGSLPEAHSDFIFAVIGEELGLFGSLMVLAMFLVLGYTGIRIALRSDDMFNRYAAAGVTAWFMVQALINLGCVLRLLPIAGVPLPLVSYGGSALLANLAGIGLLLACARHEPAARAVLATKRGKTARKPRMTAVIGSRSRRARLRSRG